MRTLVAFACVLICTLTTVARCDESDDKIYQTLKHEILRIQKAKTKLSEEIFEVESTNYERIVQELHDNVLKEMDKVNSYGKNDCTVHGINVEVVKREAQQCEKLLNRFVRDRSYVTSISTIRSKLDDLHPDMEYYVNKCNAESRSGPNDQHPLGVFWCVQRMVSQQIDLLKELSNREKREIKAKKTLAERAERCYDNLNLRIQDYYKACGAFHHQ